MPLKTRFFQLRHDYELKPFDCGNSEVNSFLTDQCQKRVKHLLSKVYVLENEEVTMGFFSLSNSVISIQNSRSLKSGINKLMSRKDVLLLNLVRIDALPCIKVDAIGIHQEFQSKEHGTNFLNYIKVEARKSVSGCIFIIVHVYDDPSTINFYNKKFIPSLTRLLRQRGD